MSGDNQRSDDLDPIDDDFVIEDLGSKGDDLDPLFAPPVAPAAGERPRPDAVTPHPASQAAEGARGADEADLLFEDHTVGLRPTQNFEGRAAFAEAARSEWSGDGLDLDEVGVPPAEEAAEAVAAAESAASAAMAAAEETFSEELGSLLGEEEFTLDAETDLEVVGAEPAADGIAEFEQSGPFVIDDSEGAWQQEGVAQPAAASETGEVTQGDEPTVELDAMPSMAPVDAEPIEPGWEPLPAANVDALAEVDDLGRTDDDAAVPVGAAVGADDEEAARPFSGELLPRSGAPVLIGARRASHRSVGAMLALAAGLLLCGGTAVLFLKPQWLGVDLAPERMQVVQIERPQVKVDVPTPRLPDGVLASAPTNPTTSPVAVVPTPPPADPLASAPPVSVVPPPVAVSTEPVRSAPGETTPVQPSQVPTATAEPVAIVPQPAPAVPSPTPADAAPPAPPVAVVGPTPSVPVAAAEPWPVASTVKPDVLPAGPTGNPLVRVSENLMVGERDGTKRTVGTVEGVLPGSRAFAQLRNGNYFIGSVKCTGVDSVTLRVDEGEVTLATAELARLTELGSTDYEELQKATSGFVRLTNKNRLVGGILSKIADDHVVLEFRSNRVMLPKSAIGEVVQGEGELGIRLDLTREEDEWLKQLAERQLGTGAPPLLTPVPLERTGTAPNKPAAPLPGASPPNGPQR